MVNSTGIFSIYIYCITSEVIQANEPKVTFPHLITFGAAVYNVGKKAKRFQISQKIKKYFIVHYSAFL